MTLLAWAGPLAAGLTGLGGLISWAVKDRRKSNAESAVAERTVGSLVGLKDTDADTARQVYMQRQMDIERTFHLQQIADRDAEIERQRAELKSRDVRITSLLDQVASLERQLAEVTRQLTSVRTQLNELAEHHPEDPPHAKP